MDITFSEFGRKQPPFCAFSCSLCDIVYFFPGNTAIFQSSSVIYKHKVKPTFVFESVKKSLTRKGFEPTTFGLLVRRSTSGATESTGRGVWITNQ